MAERFTADWLALREPVDHRARAPQLLAPLAQWWRTRHGQRVVDLGSGTGSNLRYLAPRLDEGQWWRLVDRDRTLLQAAGRAGAAGVPGVARLETVLGELDREGLEEVAAADLVTASALLDLVSQSWLERLVGVCAAARCAALFSLTWDGRIEWPDPVDREGALDDALVADAVRAHQGRDKGLGPALGPDAGPVALRAFTEAGYRTQLAESPWVLGPSLTAADRALALALIDGWQGAATEQHPELAERLGAWGDRRRQGAGASAFRLTVGHVDLLALPPS